MSLRVREPDVAEQVAIERLCSGGVAKADAPLARIRHLAKAVAEIGGGAAKEHADIRSTGEERLVGLTANPSHVDQRPPLAARPGLGIDAMTDRGAGTTLVVEVDLAVPGRVIEHIVALAADSTHRDRHRARALEHRAVILALQVEPDVARLLRGEDAIDVRCSTGGTCGLADRSSPAHALHRPGSPRHCPLGRWRTGPPGRKAAGRIGRPPSAGRPAAAPGPRAASRH